MNIFSHKEAQKSFATFVLLYGSITCPEISSLKTKSTLKMKTITRTIIAIVLCLGVSISNQAQSKKRAPANTKPESLMCDVNVENIDAHVETLKRRLATKTSVLTVDQILEKYITALGGRRIIESLTSRVSKGIYARGSLLCAEFEMFQKTPNKYLFFTTSPCLPNVPVLSKGFNGELRWTDVLLTNGPEEITNVIDHYKGTATPQNDMEQDYFEMTFPSDTKLKAVFPDLRVVERALVGMCPVNVLESAKAKRKWYFDTKTGLLLAKTFPNSAKNDEIQVNYFDYRLVDGIKVPFIQRVFESNEFEIFKLTSVRHNVRIEDRRFNPPRNHEGFRLKLYPIVISAEDLKKLSERPSKQPQEPKN